MKRRTNVFITLSLLLVLFLYGGFEKVTALAPKNADGTLINTEIQQTDDAELLYKKIIDSVDIVEDNIGKYNYPVRPGMEEWASLKTTASIHLALQIPEKILHDMSTRDLVDTVLDYPILTTELLSFADKTNPFRVIEHLEKTFNGLFELLQREDVGTELLINYKETDIGSVIQLFDTDPLESIEIISQIKFTELLLAHKLVQSKLTDKEVIILNDLIIKNLEIKKIREGLFGLSISTYDEAIKYNINISNSHVVEPQYAYYVYHPKR